MTKCVGKCLCDKSLKERVTHYLTDLKKLNSAKPSVRVMMLKTADDCLIKLLCEVALNVLKGNLQLEEPQYKKLRPHKRLLLYVAKPAVSLNNRRKAFLKKKGGILPVLLPALISALAGYALNKLFG